METQDCIYFINGYCEDDNYIKNLPSHRTMDVQCSCNGTDACSNYTTFLEEPPTEKQIVEDIYNSLRNLRFKELE